MGALWLGRRRLRERYLTLARRLGIDRETTISVNFSGGGLATPQLAIVSLWPGTPEAVVESITASVSPAGYTVLNPWLPEAPVGRLTFRAPPGEGLPPLGVLIYGPGQTIQGTDVVVPPATTGLRFQL
ncbi:hypothetical protein K1W54_17975 [Micromonospora sp. CPCC 205371]|nr:hypothetical protein [Micromonospora sp. CPCC 205371]